MPEIFHVAILLICFNGNCTSFESVPFIKETSQEECQNMLRWTFETQAGPYYDERIDFEKDRPEDIDILGVTKLEEHQIILINGELLRI